MAGQSGVVCVSMLAAAFFVIFASFVALTLLKTLVATKDIKRKPKQIVLKKPML
jgi:hypothetical protein